MGKHCEEMRILIATEFDRPTLLMNEKLIKVPQITDAPMKYILP
jgi:hypothetical protein